MRGRRVRVEDEGIDQRRGVCRILLRNKVHIRHDLKRAGKSKERALGVATNGGRGRG